MGRPFLTDGGRGALERAVVTVEGQSSAEVVIAIRPSSGSYLHADLVAGVIGALVALAFLLFSPWGFALHWFLIDPVVVGLLAALASSRSWTWRRLLTPPEVRRARVLTAARAAFVEKGVHRTRARTGILVYVSLLERDACVVVDTGVEGAVDVERWNASTDALARIVRHGGDAEGLAGAIADLGPVLAPRLPRTEDDVNELADGVIES